MKPLESKIKKPKFNYKVLTNGRRFKIEKFQAVMENDRYVLLYDQTSGRIIKVERSDEQVTYEQVRHHQVAEVLSYFKDQDVKDIDLYSEIIRGFSDIDSENYARILNPYETNDRIVLAHKFAAEMFSHSYEILRVLSMDGCDFEKIDKVDMLLFLINCRVEEIKEIFNLKQSK